MPSQASFLSQGYLIEKTKLYVEDETFNSTRIYSHIFVYILVLKNESDGYSLSNMVCYIIYSSIRDFF